MNKQSEQEWVDFGKRYAEAWCSQHPDQVAAFFEDTATLIINLGTPSVGRVAIAQSAESFMSAFPDLHVSMDSLKVTPKGVEFHWTLSGRNSGPGGTGKFVKISGLELWQMGNSGLVAHSVGSFDVQEYDRQLRQGA